MLLRPIYCGSPIAYADEAREMRYALPPISADHVEQFRRATRTTHGNGIPGTFATYFRWAEFAFMGRLQIDLRNLLHTEQDYEYIEPLTVGDRITVRTKVGDIRERRGLRFVPMVSEIYGNDQLKLVSRSHFVVRSAEAKEEH